MKRTKIVCTLGPATDSVESLVQLGQAGMDVARMNFSHGTHATHKDLFAHIRAAGKKLGRPFAVLLDLQGPKIRVGDLPKEGVTIVRGKTVVFSTSVEPVPGDIPVTLPSLHKDVKKGERMLFDDGLLDVTVIKIVGHRIFAKVGTGGILFPHKGLNLPGTNLRIPALSEKDRSDALFGVRLGVDYMALSFVRSAQDVRDLRALLAGKGEKGKRIRIIAKVEKQEALDRFEEILDEADAVMVARGDLGVETPASGVPVIQKRIIEACRERGKPVIVATQMLDSMQRNPRPTRAEVSDVANAVADHADAVMLSGETASGNYPIESVAMMAETIEDMEASVFDDLTSFKVFPPRGHLQSAAAAVRMLVDALGGAPVAVATTLGAKARAVSSCRPETVIHAFTHDPTTFRQLRLVWGVEPHLMGEAMSREGFGARAKAKLISMGRVKKSDVLVSLSSPSGKRGSLRIEI